MQVVILCGGLGTRIREVSENVLPKPMIPIGSKPILWHIMNNYAQAGHTDFILCLGHLGSKVKEYFLNHQAMDTDVSVTLGRSPKIEYHGEYREEGWQVTLAETGEKAGTAARVARIRKYIKDDHFMLTYGDGVSNVDFNRLIDFHTSHSKPLSITGVVPPGRFGELDVQDDRVTRMQEKPTESNRYINGGFMVINRDFIDNYLNDCSTDLMLEQEPFAKAAEAGDMMMFKHDGFWQCMDTARDWEYLNRLWQQQGAPWSDR